MGQADRSWVPAEERTSDADHPFALAPPAVGTARQGAESNNCAPVIRARWAWPALRIPPQAERRTAAIECRQEITLRETKCWGHWLARVFSQQHALLLLFLPAKASSLPSDYR